MVGTIDDLQRRAHRPALLARMGGLSWEFNPGPEHGVLVANVLEMIQDRRVEWEFVSQHPKQSPAFAWRSEYFGFCNFQWGETLRKLKQWCESES